MEHCQACKKEYSTVYTIPDKVWKKLTPKRGEGGLLCMECAEKKARELGIHLYWAAKEGKFAKAENMKERTEQKQLELYNRIVGYYSGHRNYYGSGVVDRASGIISSLVKSEKQTFDSITDLIEEQLESGKL